MFDVRAKERGETVAVIAYGWEDEDFYKKWSGYDDPEMIAELKGPALNRLSRQSELAPAVLRIVRDVVLQDRRYVERLTRHYRLFRDTVEREQGEATHDPSIPGPSAPEPQARTTQARTTQARRKKIGRNDPCPCGSGRKYKHCCMR